ncbi:MAG: hypothetical protein EA358_01430 [Flavobacteriales bacterium]|nr:MAG: hypothetical protein EA358_01430 [Flavobacteriales bacterium]
MRITKLLFLGLILGSLFPSCSYIRAYFFLPQKRGVKITSKYIKNKNWGTKASYGVDVYMIHPRDTSHNIYNPKFSAYLLQSAVKSDTFQFYLAGEDESFYRTKKVYLEKEKKGLYWMRMKEVEGLPRKLKTLGPLPREKWYLFKRLKDHWSFYVFVDKEGVFHVYPVLPI